jgi:uncharacterized protein
MTASELDLLDWKRRIFALYEEIRTNDPRTTWAKWKATRDEMFVRHPQSPLPEDQREGFSGLEYFAYDPDYRVVGEVRDAERETLEIATSGEHPYSFTRFAQVGFPLDGQSHTLDLYWLENYGGGLFLPFHDLTSGKESYGAGRYLYDTVKGADLGNEDDTLFLDFNFAYNPSCAYDPQWVCPLAPPANRLDVEIRAGERYTQS